MLSSRLNLSRKAGEDQFSSSKTGRKRRNNYYLDLYLIQDFNGLDK